MAFYSREVVIERDYRQELLELDMEYGLPKWFWSNKEWIRYSCARMALVSKIEEGNRMKEKFDGKKQDLELVIKDNTLVFTAVDKPPKVKEKEDHPKRRSSMWY